MPTSAFEAHIQSNAAWALGSTWNSGVLRKKPKTMLNIHPLHI